jgi:hypothetical protein
VSDQRDPFFDHWAERQRPPLRNHRRAVARIEHAAQHHELAAIDAELEVLCARRRSAVGRLDALRSELWPGDATRHRRRRARVDEIPIPPAPAGAVPLGGVELRAACIGILRRHGACALRELHGLLHRHGYFIDGHREVQRLADAMAYEVRQGRAVRIARGVYGAVGDGPRIPGPEPLVWTDPDEDRPQVDPVVLDDPERWSDGTWPDPPDRSGSQIRPADRYEASTLDDDASRARARAAALADDRTPGPLDTDRWDRFVDESVPTVRTWAHRRRLWAQRAAERERERRRGAGPPWLWPEDGGSEPG